MPLSTVQCCVAFFTCVGLTEVIVVNYFEEDPEQDVPMMINGAFAALLLVDLVLRIRLSSASHANLWWPVAPTIFACLLAENLERYMSSGDGKFMKALKWKVIGLVTRQLRNPARAYRLFKMSMNILRWVTWGLPMLGMLAGLKDAFNRFLLIRKERIESARKLKALQASFDS